MNNVVQITKENFEQEVLHHNGKVVLDFYADWCGACQMLRPTLNNLSQELENVKFAFVNVDRNPELSQAFMVMSIPALYLVENGKVISRQIGALSKPQLKQFINE